jgi:hypothetical protein
VKSKLWSTVLCLGLLCLVPSPSEAQGTAPQPAAPAQPAPAQAPPAQQTPAQAAPAPQPSTTTQAPPAAPIPPKKEDHDTGGDFFSIEPILWVVKEPPVLRLGYAGEFTTNAYGVKIYNQTTPGDLNFPGGSKYADGIVVTVPTPKENSVEFTFWHVQGEGNTTAATDLILFNNSFPLNDALVTSYAFQDYKLSWNYLTYPYPSNGSRFRFKTLWEFQFLNVTSLTSAPADVNASNTTGNKHIFLPTLGAGIEYHLAKNLLFELKGSGFGIIHHMDIWDAQASLVWRLGHLEAFVGAKGFHFKTSPKADQYFTDTLLGPEVGLRWIFR